VKDPALPGTLYVTELVVSETVNGMPEATIKATADHGELRGDTVHGTSTRPGRSSPTVQGGKLRQFGSRGGSEFAFFLRNLRTLAVALARWWHVRCCRLPCAVTGRAEQDSSRQADPSTGEIDQ
jgi:hypothetical protein